MKYKIFDSEDEITYCAVAYTKAQTKMKNPPMNALTVETDNYDTAKGITRGMLEANSKYVYAFVLKFVAGYKDDSVWGIKSSTMVYDIWKDFETEGQDTNTPGIVH